MERKYLFSWDLLGDISLGRPNLGNTASVEVYRLMQYAFRDVLERKFDTEIADEIFYETGKLVGEEFYKHYCSDVTDFNQLAKRLQTVMKDLGIGVLRVEKANVDIGEFMLTVGEDLDCSGLPEVEYEVCTYDEGFIAGIFGLFTGKKFHVKEVDCWCTGDRTCRFSAVMEK